MKIKFLLCCLALLLIGCGYHLPSRAELTLPGGISKLHMEQVQDTTGEPGLQARLRSLLTEEVQRRTNAQWTEPEQSQGLLSLAIHEYQVATSLEDVTERTVKSEARISFSARIVDSKDGELLWESGDITGTESFVGPEGGAAEQEAEYQALEQAVQDLVQRLGHTF